MSIGEEDNSPFGESSYHEDEFTDLPLEEDNENEIVSGEQVTDNSEEPVSTTPAAPVHVSNTQVYDPDAYTTAATTNSSFNDDLTIEILDAGKSHEGASRGYIVYTIKCNDLIVRRRYSEFESLRNALVRLFPTSIIPPIPSKHNLTKYATAPTKAKDDDKIINHRKRMLGVFLNRCFKIEKIKNNETFQKFLDPNSNWSEVLHSPNLTNIPKNILQADPLNPSNSSAAHSYLPIPTSSTLQARSSQIDMKFNKFENTEREYESIISNGIEKTNKKLIKHLQEFGLELSESGIIFNAFSLEETGKLAPLLEKIGQIHDNSYVSTQSLVESLNYEFTEPLGESVQFVSVVKDLLKYRQQKSLQFDISTRSLKHKTNQLKLIERSEEESKRIMKAIEDGSVKTGQINFDRNVAKKQAAEAAQAESEADGAPLEPKKSSSSFKIPGISNLTNIIKSSMETDPEATRKQNLTKTRDDLNQLKQTFVAAESDIKIVNESIESELESFQKEKILNQKKMIQAYSKSILEWSRKNLEYWEETKSLL